MVMQKIIDQKNSKSRAMESHDNIKENEDVSSTEDIKTEEVDISEKEDIKTRKRAGNEGLVALKSQNEAFLIFKSFKARSFTRKISLFKTIGGNSIKANIWQSDEQSRTLTRDKIKEKIPIRCEQCNKNFVDKKNLTKHTTIYHSIT